MSRRRPGSQQALVAAGKHGWAFRALTEEEGERHAATPSRRSGRVPRGATRPPRRDDDYHREAFVAERRATMEQQRRDGHGWTDEEIEEMALHDWDEECYEHWECEDSDEDSYEGECARIERDAAAERPAIFAQVAANSPRLTYLCFSGPRMDGMPGDGSFRDGSGDTEALCAALRGNTHVTSIGLEGSHFDDADCVLLEAVLPHTNVHDVGLWWTSEDCCVSWERYTAVAALCIANSFRRIRSGDQSACQLDTACSGGHYTPETLKALTPLLVANQRVQSAELRVFGLTNSALDEFASAIRRTGLRRASVTWPRDPPDGLDVAAAKVAQGLIRQACAENKTMDKTVRPYQRLLLATMFCKSWRCTQLGVHELSLDLLEQISLSLRASLLWPVATLPVTPVHRSIRWHASPSVGYTGPFSWRDADEAVAEAAAKEAHRINAELEEAQRAEEARAEEGRELKRAADDERSELQRAADDEWHQGWMKRTKVAHARWSQPG